MSSSLTLLSEAELSERCSGSAAHPAAALHSISLRCSNNVLSHLLSERWPGPLVVERSGAE